MSSKNLSRNAPRKRIYVLMVFFLLFAFSVLYPESIKPTIIKKEIQWGNNSIIVDIEMPLEKTEKVFPVAKSKAELAIEQNMPFIIKKTLESINIDSYTSLKDKSEELPELLNFFSRQKIKKIFSRMSKDNMILEARYKIAIYPDIVSFFVNHTQTSEIPYTMNYTPTREFSGLVIFAKGKLPVHGEKKKEKLQPALFYRIYNDKMDLLFEKEMVNPEYLRKWGMGSYSSSINLKTQENRIGRSPLKIAAVGIFGKNYTDIIIAGEDANKLLYDNRNRKNFLEGRILIILDNWN